VPFICNLDCIRRACVVLLAVLAAGVAGAQTPAPRAPAARTGAGANVFVVFLAGGMVGREELAVTRQADGWIIRGSSRLNPPVGTIVRHVEIRYDAEWRARSLELDASVQGQDVTLKTAFADARR
jgi:hypothetical protein